LARSLKLDWLLGAVCRSVMSNSSCVGGQGLPSDQT
jgi:hypothetical protein